jgi:hypothetical protein
LIASSPLIEGPFVSGTEYFISFVGTISYNQDGTPNNKDQPRAFIYQRNQQNKIITQIQ